MFEGLTPTHLILVLAIALLVVGPGKLPEVGAALGRSIMEFRSAVQGTDSAAPPEPAAGESDRT
jgi:sec-independent protein translocase protein TatA